MLNWTELRQTCESCTKCGLCKTRTNVVFGVGPEDADIIFVGEGPGEQEDLQGEPFVGPAGQLLDDMLRIIDLDRNSCYIANIVKCRPPRNRDPEPAEQTICMEYLKNQVQLLRPRVMVCLGRVAARQFLFEDFRMSDHHGTWYCRDGIWTMGTYHPSALLRDPTKRPAAFNDLLSVREKLYEARLQLFR